MVKKTCHIKKGDRVKVITGKEKGKIGNVLKVMLERDKLIVESLNMVKRHTKGGGRTRQSGVVEKEAPIHLSNVMLMCNKCIKPMRIKKRVLEDGRKVRVCGQCDEIIDA